MIPITIPMTVSVSMVTFPMSVSVSEISLAVNPSAEYRMVSADVYDGQYEFTPTQQTQTVATFDKLLTQNITINPIPSDYGKITWNGSILTVS